MLETTFFVSEFPLLLEQGLILRRDAVFGFSPRPLRLRELLGDRFQLRQLLRLPPGLLVVVVLLLRGPRPQPGGGEGVDGLEVAVAVLRHRGRADLLLREEGGSGIVY